MPAFNHITLLGNTTRDCQLRYLPNNTPVVDFGLAVTEKYKTKTGEEREDTLFVDCSCFGRGAEIINQYVQKGRPLLVSGKLKYQTWEDKQGGGKRSKHTVVVENFQLMGDRGGNSGGGQRQGGTAPSQRPPKPQEQEQPSFEESDIPFAWQGRMDQPI